MKKIKLIIKSFVVIILFTSCQTHFDQNIWAKNNNFLTKKNPRSKMLDDLLNNYLKKGMTKKDIIILLGKPFEDIIEYRLPKGVEIPDSISIISSFNKSRMAQKKSLDLYNKWYKANSQPDTLLLYIVGWSLMDAKFLVVKMDDKNIAYDFWVEQH